MNWRKLNWKKWLDEFAIAGKGILLASKEKRFCGSFLIAFFFFGVLMNLLSGGFSKFELMMASGFLNSLKIIANAFLETFGFNKNFSDWFLIFSLSFLQGLLIGLIIYLWRKKREQNSENLQKAGIISGLIVLGAGCPTCGTTLITPLIGTIFSTGSFAIASTLSIVITVLAILIAILSLKRLGVETYAIIINEKYLTKKRSQKNEKNS